MSGRHLTTKEYDSDANLYYFWQRWYDPQVGRFRSKATYPPYLEHPYAYASGNPAFYSDPSGRYNDLFYLGPPFSDPPEKCLRCDWDAVKDCLLDRLVPVPCLVPCQICVGTMGNPVACTPCYGCLVLYYGIVSMECLWDNCEMEECCNDT